MTTHTNQEDHLPSEPGGRSEELRSLLLNGQKVDDFEVPRDIDFGREIDL